jgi:hypothetical protein
MQKDLLFYSNFCDHSKDIINIINKKNVRDHFMFICVDNSKFKIPDFITVVPTLLTTKKQIIVGQNLYIYIDKISQVSSVQDIIPFTIGSSSFSSDYTWLSPDGNGYQNNANVDDTRNNSFILLNSDANINAPKDVEDTKHSKFDSTIYEKFISNRANDDENIKRILDSEGRMAIIR